MGHDRRWMGLVKDGLRSPEDREDLLAGKPKGKAWPVSRANVECVRIGAQQVPRRSTFVGAQGARLDGSLG